MWLFVVLFCLFLFCSSTAAAVKEEVWQLSGEKKYDRALTLIQQQRDWRANDELYFLYVQVTAWSGNISLANDRLDELLYKNPENIDYLMMKSRLLLWNKEYVASLVLLDTLLGQVPENEEARGVLLKVVSASVSDGVDLGSWRETLLDKYKQWLPGEVISALFLLPVPSAIVPVAVMSSSREVQDKYKVFADLSVSSLSNGSPNWVEQLYGVVYRGNEYVTPVVSLSHLSRYDITDSNVSVDLYAKQGIHSLHVSASRSLYEKLIPSYSITSSYGINPARYFGADFIYKFDRYLAVKNQTGAVQARVPVGRSELVYKFSSTFVGDVGRGASNSLALRVRNDGNWIATAGFSYGDELEVDASGNVNLYRVSNYIVGLKYQYNRQIDFGLTFVRHVQGTVYVRSGLTGGISVSF